MQDIKKLAEDQAEEQRVHAERHREEQENVEREMQNMRKKNCSQSGVVAGSDRCAAGGPRMKRQAEAQVKEQRLREKRLREE